MPLNLELGFLRDARLRVVQHIELRVHETDEGMSVYSPALDEFGCGNDLEEAIEDFQHSVADLFFSLEERSSSLGTHLQEVWKVLRELVQRR